MKIHGRLELFKGSRGPHYGNVSWIHFGLHDFMVTSWKSGGGPVGSTEHLLGLRVWVVGLNFTLFKESTIEATRERKATPWTASSRALQGFKQLRMVHGSAGDTMPPSDLLQLDPSRRRESAIHGGQAISIG